MNNAANSHPLERTSGAEQLTLLPGSAVSPRFQLSRQTRERGLRHVAEIRRLLAAQMPATPASDDADRFAPRQNRAA
jgi:hypothetical protein